MAELLTGDGSFSFVAQVEGDDIVVRNVVATWFGGPNDPNDSGETASGVRTDTNPLPDGCALPMDGFRHSHTNGSPLPKIPWRTQVAVTNKRTGKEMTAPLIDLGPSKFALSKASIDLTPPVFQALGGKLRDGIMHVDYRVVGGAAFVPDLELHSVSLAKMTNSTDLLDPTRRAFTITPVEDAETGQAIAKPPIKKVFASPYRGSRNGATIDRIILHYTAGPTVQSTISWFLNNPRQVSAHYVIDKNGDIYQMVPDAERANHCRGANSSSIGIEHVAEKSEHLTGQQEAASVALIKWLLATYDLLPSAITGHRFAPNYIGSTDCPDALFGSATEAALRTWVQVHFFA